MRARPEDDHHGPSLYTPMHAYESMIGVETLAAPIIPHKYLSFFLTYNTKKKVAELLV